MGQVAGAPYGIGASEHLEAATSPAYLSGVTAWPLTVRGWPAHCVLLRFWSALGLPSIPGSKSGEVTSLESRKRSLEAGMAERRSEIEMQLELMQVGEQGLLVIVQGVGADRERLQLCTGARLEPHNARG